ncbi:hypothetical protein CA840_03135 [Fusobacterium polymorphum]|uniref:PIN family toxin-antitoxin system n=1 Tax=Fusobacterium nucleatum subsp. polymorphum TaxID=76857 RepID=A0A2C6A320_FUSNP|nr:hypothetical protein CA840_03135 [Fusobacterium polymorphum]
MKNSSLLSRFLNIKKSRIRYKFSQLADKSASNMLRFVRLILFDFLSKIYNRNSLVFSIWKKIKDVMWRYYVFGSFICCFWS